MRATLWPENSTPNLEVMTEINMTPLIDVMLVLLMMLIITIPIQNHAARLNMPVGKPPAVVQLPSIVTVDIDSAGVMLWNGERVNGRAELEARMQKAAAMAESDQPEFHIRPNKATAYKWVAAVLSASQRIGLVKIGIISSES